MMTAKTANKIANEKFPIIMDKREKATYRRIARDIKKASKEGEFYIDYYKGINSICMDENLFSTLTINGYRITKPMPHCVRISWTDADLRKAWEKANDL